MLIENNRRQTTGNRLLLTDNFLGQDAEKNIGVAPIISHGNMPIFGNNAQVVMWNATSAVYANGRERRHSSQPTMVRSKSAPAQLMAYAVHACCSSAPKSGISPC